MSDTLELDITIGAEPRPDQCRACASRDLIAFGSSTGIPVNNARVFDLRREALGVPSGDLELTLCRSCGFAQNSRFDPELVRYDASYEEQQGFSPTFTAFSEKLAAELVWRWKLHGKRIVEIGCGKGDFLAALCDLGNNTGLGIDPTAIPGRLERASDRVTLERAFYDESYGPIEADAVVCRHTLEHISEVGDFVRTLRRSLEASPNARVFIEVPDLMRVLRDGAFWDVYYEHCSYFTLGSLARLMRANGFIVDDVRLGFENQYVLLEAHLSGEANPPLRSEETPADVARAATAYASRVESEMRAWGQRVRRLRDRGGRFAVWGSGSKCVAFLSETGIAAGVDAVVDINPFRQGRFLPRSGIQVSAPEALVEINPELVVVMNAAYVDEIRNTLNGLNLRPRLEAVG